MPQGWLGTSVSACMSEPISAHLSSCLWAPAAEVAALAAQLQLAAPLEELLMQAQLLEQLAPEVRASSSRLAAPVAQGSPDGETQLTW